MRCTRGSILCVAVDLRPDSKTLAQHFAIRLSAADGLQLYVPTRMANGFQVLEDASEVLYLMSSYYAPEAAAGYRFDDPTFAIEWPLPVSLISEQDRSLPLFDRADTSF